MARTPSIIMSKTEKKAALAELTAEIRAVKQEIKDFAGETKIVEKTLKEAIKAHASGTKSIEKDVASANKRLALLEAKRSALANDPSAGAAAVREAVAQPVVKRTRRTKAEMEAARAATA